MKAVMPEVPQHVLQWRKRIGADQWDEMWEGVLHMAPSPNRDHQDFEFELEAWLRKHWATPNGCRVYHQINISDPGTWPNNYRIPDLVLLTPERFDIDCNSYFDGGPDAVVEIHSPGDEAYEKVVSSGGALEALTEAREAGKVAHIGISCHDLNTAVRAIRSGEFEVLEIPFSAVENSEQHFEVIELANKLDIGVVAMKPLSGGNLSNPELALRYILQYDISTAIPGARKPEEARQNAMVGWDPRPLSGDEQSVLFEEARALGQTFCRRCGYCMPCTVGIDIPNTFIADTQARAAIARGDTRILEVVRKGYAMVEVKADQCLDDGVCEERCPYHLPIGEMMRAAQERLIPSSSKPL